jgi:hypothetical protein
MLLKAFKSWLEGIKVLCGYFAFTLVLCFLYFPGSWVINKVGLKFGDVFGIVALILIVPLIFYVGARYLQIIGKEAKFPILCPKCSVKITESDLNQ